MTGTFGKLAMQGRPLSPGTAACDVSGDVPAMARICEGATTMRRAVIIMFIGLICIATTNPPSRLGPVETSAERNAQIRLVTRLEALENVTRWNDDLSASIMPLIEVSNTIWTACLIRRRDALAPSREPVDAVVSAIMGGCAQKENLVRRATALGFRGSATPEERERRAITIMERAKSRQAERIIMYLVEWRAERGR